MHPIVWRLLIVCTGCRIAFFQDNDRVDRALQVPLFLFRNDSHLVNIVRADHDSEWLFDPSEPVLQPIGRFFDACEMKSSYTPHCKDFSCIEQFCCFPEGIQADYLISLCIGEFEPGATRRAGNCLGVVAPAAGIRILPLYRLRREEIPSSRYAHGHTGAY